MNDPSVQDPLDQERQELLHQLDELLGAGIVDISDALELATCAGLATRLGVDPAALDPVQVWRDGPGQLLLPELWEQAEVEPLIDAIEGLLGVEAEDRVVEEAFFDFDDLVAAAVWSGRREVVAAAAKQVAGTLRMAPDSFSALAGYGAPMARLRTLADDMDLYDYWFAVAELAP